MTHEGPGTPLSIPQPLVCPAFVKGSRRLSDHVPPFPSSSELCMVFLAHVVEQHPLEIFPTRPRYCAVLLQARPWPTMTPLLAFSPPHTDGDSISHTPKLRTYPRRSTWHVPLHARPPLSFRYSAFTRTFRTFTCPRWPVVTPPPTMRPAQQDAPPRGSSSPPIQL